MSELTNHAALVAGQLRDAQSENRRLTEMLHHAERTIEEQKVNIADKEKQVLNLRAGNRTLDNFRFVLDHRINQLTQERGTLRCMRCAAPRVTVGLSIRSNHCACG